MDDLTDEEKFRVTLQVDHFIELLSKRYGINPTDIVEAMQWVRDHRSIESKIQFGAWVSVIGVLIGGLMMATWEGIKHLANGKGP